MRDKIPGLNKVTAKLAGGRTATYYYHRATSTKLPGAYGSPEFLDALVEAQKAPADRDAGVLAGLIRRFQRTPEWRDLAESTKKEYRRVFKFWEDKHGTVPLAGLAAKGFRKDVLQWHSDFAVEHPREADNRVAILARILAWGERDDDLAKNVLDTFKRAYSGDRSDIIWEPAQIAAFMSVARPEMQLAMVLALHTGQRQADIRALAWTNYNGETITLRQGKSRKAGKPGKLVTVPCTAALRDTLDNLPKKGALILTTVTGRAFTKKRLNETWTDTMRAAGLDPKALHFHDLRGTAITLLFEAGCTVAEAASISGHTLRTAQNILDRYLSRTAALARSAIIKFENRMKQEPAKGPAKGAISREAK